MTRPEAEAAVTAIVNDLRDRRGLRQQWDEIDRDIQREIEQCWARLILQTEVPHAS